MLENSDNRKKGPTRQRPNKARSCYSKNSTKRENNNFQNIDKKRPCWILKIFCNNNQHIPKYVQLIHGTLNLKLSSKQCIIKLSEQIPCNHKHFNIRIINFMTWMELIHVGDYLKLYICTYLIA